MLLALAQIKYYIPQTKGGGWHIAVIFSAEPVSILIVYLLNKWVHLAKHCTCNKETQLGNGVLV